MASFQDEMAKAIMGAAYGPAAARHAKNILAMNEMQEIKAFLAMAKAHQKDPTNAEAPDYGRLSANVRKWVEA